MASKRILKKNVNAMVYDVVDECFDIQRFDEKQTTKTEKLIDEAADFQDEILQNIKAAKNKADFKRIKEKIEAKAVDFVKKLNAIN